MAWTNGAFDNTKPANSRDPRLGAGDIREWKKQVAEFLGTMLYGLSATEVTETLMGFKHIRLMVQAGDPGATANCVKIYAKDVAGKAERFAQDEDGNVIQITSGGKLNAVLLTGDQTVAGIKTFSSIPVGPDADPTTDDQLARKSYVDDEITDNLITITRARAVKSGGNQAISATEAKVTFQTESYDTGEELASSVFTAKKAGYVDVNAMIKVYEDGSSTAYSMAIRIKKNGVLYSEKPVYISAAGNAEYYSFSHADQIPVEVDDYIEIFWYAGATSVISDGSFVTFKLPSK